MCLCLNCSRKKILLRMEKTGEDAKPDEKPKVSEDESKPAENQSKADTTDGRFRPGDTNTKTRDAK